MRILALATHGEAGPSTRLRVLQWRPSLEDAGFSLSVHPFFSAHGARGLSPNEIWVRVS